MNRKEDIETKMADNVLQELWETKDYYSLSCNADFEVLVKKVREDIKRVEAVDIHDKAFKLITA